VFSDANTALRSSVYCFADTVNDLITFDFISQSTGFNEVHYNLSYNIN